MDPFYKIVDFESQLAAYTGAPYCVAVDCCTHAIELAMRYDKVKYTEFSAYNYISVLMTMHKLGIDYKLLDDKWVGQYHFHHTRIVDSARQLTANMYLPGTIMCVSFGRTKPLDLHRGGALLLDDAEAYNTIRLQRYDGRDLTILPWESQKKFKLGFHYKMTPDEAVLGSKKLANHEINLNQIDWSGYPDCREIEIDE
jgi:dTDP-4-amino-4,6-dideoxygalactose transaminase